MRLRLYYFGIIFFVFCGISYSQEPKLYDKIEDKVVIGFPGLTEEQMNFISVEFAKYNQIASAKYISGNHNCMLITFKQGNNFTVYAEMLKVISGIYNVEQCYFKAKDAFAEILSSKSGTEFIVK